jgi:uncharacterized protein HemX
MGDVLKYPLKDPATNNVNFSLAIFAGMTLLLSIGSAAVVSAWILGASNAATTHDIANLVALVRLDHDETARHLDSLSNTVSMLATQAGTNSSQIGDLRQAIQQERQDRIDWENRQNQGRYK